MNSHDFVIVILLFFLSLFSTGDFGTTTISISYGTALYGDHDRTRKWSEQEAFRLQTRMMVEQLLPRRVLGGAVFIEYVRLIVEKSKDIDNDQTEKDTLVAVTDVIGGYMQGVLLPRVKAAYYEGYEDYNVTSQLYGMMRKIK